MSDNAALPPEKRNPFCDIPGCDCQSGPPIVRCDECQAAEPHHRPICSRYESNRGYGVRVKVPAPDAPLSRAAPMSTSETPGIKVTPEEFYELQQANALLDDGESDRRIAAVLGEERSAIVRANRHNPARVEVVAASPAQEATPQREEEQTMEQGPANHANGTPTTAGNGPQGRLREASPLPDLAIAYLAGAKDERGHFGAFHCGRTDNAIEQSARNYVALSADPTPEASGARCESCQRPFSEHGEPHEWDAERRPSCPAPSLTGTYRAPAREASSAPRERHDVSFFVQKMDDAREIVGQRDGLDVYLLGAMHVLHHYAEKMRESEATVAALTAERTALREVVEDFALVERHIETRANGCSDLYRMPFRGASWFDSREAAVTDWLAARAAPRGETAP